MTDSTDLALVPETTPGTDLSVSEKLQDLVTRRADAFLPETTRQAPPARQDPAPTVTETERKNILSHHHVAVTTAGTQLEQAGQALIREVAALQREWAACASLMAVDPVAGQKMKSDLMAYQSTLMEKDNQLAQLRENFTQNLYAMAEQYLWGCGPDAMAARDRELPELVKWGKAQGMSNEEILLAGQSPAVAHGLYLAWRAGSGLPVPKTPPKAPKAVPSPSGRTPPAVRAVPKRRTGGRDVDIDAEAGAALLKGLHRGR